MLLRTLLYLPPGGVFGVVVPQGVLRDKESKAVRLLLAQFDLSEVGIFADNLFEHGDHEAAVLIGRRTKEHARRAVLHYRRVREQDMEAFKDRLAFSSEREVLQTQFARRRGCESAPTRPSGGVGVSRAASPARNRVSSVERIRVFQEGVSSVPRALIQQTEAGLVPGGA